ncbi:MAG TPA: nucleotidyltransferase domain-containing protein [Clostridiales bacterium]|nr:nucleotidyltransferase domain-containing protein [Clostridiales bacterium]
MKNRSEITEGLKSLLEKNDKVIAVWEGGSAATGFLDDHSDLDLAVVCEDDAVEDVFFEIESHLESVYGIEEKFRMPEPAWHGFSQCFYKTGNVPELFYFDIAVIKRSNPNKFTETDRHGEAVIWFEKEKMVVPSVTPEEEIISKGKKLFHMATDTLFLTEIELKKALARRNFTEAFHQYFLIIYRTLGILLNLKYRPCKSDFGLRYADRDYEKHDAEFLDGLFKVTSTEELREKSDKVLLRISELREELETKWK